MSSLRCSPTCLYGGRGREVAAAAAQLSGPAVRTFRCGCRTGQRARQIGVISQRAYAKRWIERFHAAGKTNRIQLSGRCQRAGSEPSMRGMSTSVLAEKRISTAPSTAKPYLLGGLAALSAGAAAIHFAVTFQHFSEYTLYGVFFLIISWAQAIWAAVVLWRPSKLWLWLGVAGNAMIVVVYFATRLTGLPFGPDKHHTEAFGALDLVSIIFEVALIAGCAALLWRPSLLDRPVRRRTGFAGVASLAAFPAAVIAVSAAVMTPGWAGPEGPAGMASTMSSLSSAAAAPGAQAGMGDMGTTDGHPDMKMYGSPAPATAAQVIAAANLIKETDTTLARYENVQAAFAAGYTYILRTNGEEHLLYDGKNRAAFAGLNPQHPSSLVYAIDVPHHAPILLGAM